MVYQLQLRDMRGVTLSQLNPRFITLCTKWITFATSHYPETASVVIMINLPQIFPIIWTIVKKLLDEQTTKKIAMFPEHNTEASRLCLELVTPDNLPVQYGGTLMHALPRTGLPLSIESYAGLPYLIKPNHSHALTVHLKAGKTARWRFRHYGAVDFAIQYRRKSDRSTHDDASIAVDIQRETFLGSYTKQKGYSSLGYFTAPHSGIVQISWTALDLPNPPTERRDFLSRRDSSSMTFGVPHGTGSVVCYTFGQDDSEVYGGDEPELQVSDPQVGEGWNKYMLETPSWALPVFQFLGMDADDLSSSASVNASHLLNSELETAGYMMLACVCFVALWPWIILLALLPTK
jgi:hypothetical protein